jgi:RimJ/RimL family protein N-acetyltransferase
VTEVTVRTLRLQDIPALAALVHNNVDHIARFIRASQSPTRDVLNSLTSAYLATTEGRRWEGVIEEDGRLVGRLRVLPIAGREWDLDGEIVILIAEDACGCGVGTRALSALCGQWANRLWARVDEANTASVRIFESNDFERVSEGPFEKVGPHQLFFQKDLDPPAQAVTVAT